MSDHTEITKELLEEWDFSHVDNGKFENIKLKYYAKNSVLLFYNDSPPYNTYFIGYGFMFNGKYYASTFRWISDPKDLKGIYESITGKLIKEPI